MTQIFKPTKFSDVIGNREAVSKVKSIILNRKLYRGVVIEGVYGCGKSTIAHLLRAGLNCPHFKDSNDICNECSVHIYSSNNVYNCYAQSMTNELFTGLKLAVSFLPSLKIPVFIFEEVHAWSEKDFGKMHTILDAVDGNILFVFTTHDPARLETPFLSRCTRISLKPLKPNKAQELIDSMSSFYKVNLPKNDMDQLIYRSRGIPRNIVREMAEIHSTNSLFP
jgi:DNA polymerase-3 subunit gamma/tau